MIAEMVRKCSHYVDIPDYGHEILAGKYLTFFCLCDHKISRGGVVGIILKTANIIFGHQWTINSNQLDENFNDLKSDSDEPKTSTVADNLKRHHKTRDLIVFPSARTILEDKYINLQMAAKYFLNKDSGDVVTVGLDDATKAAGHKLYDIKADHITISGPDRE
jgi:hypothetical protein